MTTKPLDYRAMRTFCLLNAALFLCVAVVFAFLRFLIGQGAAVGETLQPALLAQEEFCAVLLVFFAALLLRVRAALTGPHLVQVGRNAKFGTLAGAMFCIGGMCFAAIVPLSGEVTAGRFPTIAATALTVVFAFFSYAGLSKLPK